jgi:hypothetical protein
MGQSLQPGSRENLLVFCEVTRRGLFWENERQQGTRCGSLFLAAPSQTMCQPRSRVTNRASLSEFLVPHHLGFFVYAAARGDFGLGGLQAVFEGEMHLLLRDFVTGEHRCALDPGCTQNGAACMACLHLGEPSCRLFNRSLDRRTLYGPLGYLMQFPVVDAGRPAQAVERV